MTVKTIANVAVDVDEEGYLTDPGAWTPEIAAALAAEEGVELTDRHWTVIRFVRDDYAQNGKSPSLRRITKQSGIDTKELYALFPKGPGKKVARIAGVPKPEGCV
jgi:TusE/DsrC/DsvC family sulfur relay protein